MNDFMSTCIWDFRKNNSHIVIKGEKNLHNLIHNKTSAVFVSGHFANYELMSMEITKRNIKLATIYRPLNNFFLNPLMESLRKKYVCKNQIKKGINGVREAIEYIKKGFSIALMIDQRVSEGEKINLFNKLALTTTLPAQLSLKYNLPIIPVFIERTKENNFEITFHEEIKPNEFKSKIDLTAKLNRILEQMIKKNPYQWIWTHNSEINLFFKIFNLFLLTGKNKLFVILHSSTLIFLMVFLYLRHCTNYIITFFNYIK